MKQISNISSLDFFWYSETWEKDILKFMDMLSLLHTKLLIICKISVCLPQNTSQFEQMLESSSYYCQ